MNRLHKMRQYGARRAVDILENLMKNNLWKRILKSTIATTAAGEPRSIGSAVVVKANIDCSQYIPHTWRQQDYRQSSLPRGYDDRVWPSWTTLWSTC